MEPNNTAFALAYHSKRQRLQRASETAYNKAWASLPETEKRQYPPKWINLSEGEQNAIQAAVAKAQNAKQSTVKMVTKVLPLFNVKLLDVVCSGDNTVAIVEHYLLPYSRRFWGEIWAKLNNLKLNPDH